MDEERMYQKGGKDGWMVKRRHEEDKKIVVGKKKLQENRGKVTN